MQHKAVRPPRRNPPELSNLSNFGFRLQAAADQEEVAGLEVLRQGARSFETSWGVAGGRCPFCHKVSKRLRKRFVVGTSMRYHVDTDTGYIGSGPCLSVSKVSAENIKGLPSHSRLLGRERKSSLTSTSMPSRAIPRDL